MTDNELVELSNSFAEFSQHIEGINSIDGQAYDLIKRAMELESGSFTDSDCISIIENIIENYHMWHKVDAGEVD